MKNTKIISMNWDFNGSHEEYCQVIGKKEADRVAGRIANAYGIAVRWYFITDPKQVFTVKPGKRGPLHISLFALLCAFLPFLFSCKALTDPCQRGLIRWNPSPTVVQADSMQISHDAKWLIIHVPENYRVMRRGRWYFPMPAFMGVDTVLVVDRQMKEL